MISKWGEVKPYHLPWKARHSSHSKLLDWHCHLMKPHLGQSSPSILDWRKWWKASIRNKEVAESTEQKDQSQESDYSLHVLDSFSESLRENGLGNSALLQCMTVRKTIGSQEKTAASAITATEDSWCMQWDRLDFGWAAAAATLSCLTSICA